MATRPDIRVDAKRRNLMTLAQPNLADGEAYAVQNIGDRDVRFADAAAVAGAKAAAVVSGDGDGGVQLARTALGEYEGAVVVRPAAAAANSSVLLAGEAGGGLRVVRTAAGADAGDFTLHYPDDAGDVTVAGNDVELTPLAGSTSLGEIKAQLEASADFAAAYTAALEDAAAGDGLVLPAAERQAHADVSGTHGAVLRVMRLAGSSNAGRVRVNAPDPDTAASVMVTNAGVTVRPAVGADDLASVADQLAASATFAASYRAILVQGAHETVIADDYAFEGGAAAGETVLEFDGGRAAEAANVAVDAGGIEIAAAADATLAALIALLNAESDYTDVFDNAALTGGGLGTDLAVPGEYAFAGGRAAGLGPAQDAMGRAISGGIIEPKRIVATTVEAANPPFVWVDGEDGGPGLLSVVES